MSEATPTIGAAEVKALQAAGWKLWTSGPQCANGWPVIFRRGEESRVEILTNDMSRWPAETPNEPDLFSTSQQYSRAESHYQPSTPKTINTLAPTP